MKGAVGRIYGEASSTDFSFVVFDPREVGRTDYVKVWNDVEGWVVAQIYDVKATADLNENDVLLGRNAEKEVYIAKALVIGKRDENGLLRVPKTPFVPGESVFKADSEIITSALGLESDGAYIGLLKDSEIKVNLNLNSLVQKHCCILAKTGSGKSYTSGVIVEELLERDVPLFIIDPHGEYSTMKFPNDSREEVEKMSIFKIKPKGYENKIRLYVPPNSPFVDKADGILRLDGYNLTAEEIIELTGITNPTSHALLYQAIKNLKGRNYTVEDVIAEIEEIKHNAKWSLLGHLEKILESGLFGKEATPVHLLLQNGKAVILDMRGVPPEHQDLIVSRICSRLFELRKKEEVPAGMIVIEEAHNFIPERGFGRAVSTQVLRTIASEGRKFGLGLMVISQRPARVDKNVISQCNTQIILRVTNPNDINAIKKGVEGLTADTVEEIKRLPAGTAMVVSPELERPVIVNVRIRKSRHGGVSANIVKKKQKEKPKEKRTEKDVKEKQSLLRKMFG
ncbi:MAG TPA: ATP-binding protein [Archaeoglobaceae archaeon]|nr:ATP-binding protein [Archaeoglobaceae archaeon]